jgi:hypothetical protein
MPKSLSLNLQKTRPNAVMKREVLRPCSLDRLAAASAAAARVGTVVLSVLGTNLGARGAVLEHVTKGAEVLGATALEDAGGHVRGALVANETEALAAHGDLTADVEDGDGTEGEFRPGVGDLSVAHHGIGVQGRAGTAGTGSEGGRERRTCGEGVGDVWLDCVDPGADCTPADNDDVFTRAVDVLHGTESVTADPDSAVVGYGVGADLSADGGEEARVRAGENLGGCRGSR